MLSSLVLLALLASAQGRAVNISNTWVLPEEGFPVFYRYFRDRISWYEADAVCQFHHANLVTVDTTAQYDAVRAYLKELDITSAVWVGLIRSNPDGDFTWTDYRGLSGDGYWSSAPDMRSAPLCAASNPVADYRWEARACGGPTVASFICELPVPQWALGNEGCMVRELPALTILYLPESAAVQLNADCGLAGVKRVQCTGNVKREGLLKDLSCADEEDITSTLTPTSIGTNWPATTDSDQDMTSEVTTEDNTTTELEVDINQPIVTATSLPQYINSKLQYQYPAKYTDMDNFNTVSFGKDINLGISDDHNIESNFIPKLVDEGNVLTNEQLEKLKDERHMQHKMLHEEIARVGNADNIFTQPTDHFIPPLVMAKSRMSDDMTVLSLAEKHAQQLAEKQFSKYSQNDHLNVERNNNKLSSDNTQMDKSIIYSNPNKETKKVNLKYHVPKKYVNEKYYDSKGKASKTWESKVTEIDKTTEIPLTPTTIQETRETTTTKDRHYQGTEKDFTMDLTVMLKDAAYTSEEQTVHSNYAGDVAMLETISNKKGSIANQLKNNFTANLTTIYNNKTVDNGTMEHEVIQITVISNDNPAVNTTVFEITTKMPIFRDDTDKAYTHTSSYPTTISEETHYTEEIDTVTSETTTKEVKQISHNGTTTILPVNVSFTTVTENPIKVDVTPLFISTTTATKQGNGDNTTVMLGNKTEMALNFSEIPTTMSTTAFFSDEVTAGVTDEITTDNLTTNGHNYSIAIDSNTSLEQDFNNTEIHDVDKNITSTEVINDADSPLLSGAYEPIHRPPRTRTPQQQNRKFNPFRILG